MIKTNVLHRSAFAALALDLKFPKGENCIEVTVGDPSLVLMGRVYTGRRDQAVDVHLDEDPQVAREQLASAQFERLVACASVVTRSGDGVEVLWRRKDAESSETPRPRHYVRHPVGGSWGGEIR